MKKTFVYKDCKQIIKNNNSEVRQFTFKEGENDSSLREIRVKATYSWLVEEGLIRYKKDTNGGFDFVPPAVDTSNIVELMFERLILYIEDEKKFPLNNELDLEGETNKPFAIEHSKKISEANSRGSKYTIYIDD
jgi:hypothetical protein